MTFEPHFIRLLILSRQLWTTTTVLEILHLLMERFNIIQYIGMFQNREISFSFAACQMKMRSEWNSASVDKASNVFHTDLTRRFPEQNSYLIQIQIYCLYSIARHIVLKNFGWDLSPYTSINTVRSQKARRASRFLASFKGFQSLYWRHRKNARLHVIYSANCIFSTYEGTDFHTFMHVQWC